MELLLATASFIPIILLILITHEAAHLVIGTAFSVHPTAFRVGFPPFIFSHYRGRTRVGVSPETRYIHQTERTPLVGELWIAYVLEPQPGNFIATALTPYGKNTSKQNNRWLRQPTQSTQMRQLGNDHLITWGNIKEIHSDHLIIADFALQIGLIPIGASVSFAEDSSDRAPSSLGAKSRRQRAAIIFAGPAINLVLAAAILLFTFTFLQAVSAGPLEVTDVNPGSSTDRAGIKTGDRITHAQNLPLTGLDQYSQIVQTAMRDRTAVALTYQRARETRETLLHPTVLDVDTSHTLTVLNVQPGRPGEAAGLQPDDLLISIDDQRLYTVHDYANTVTSNPGIPLEVTYLRDGATHDTSITPSPPELHHLGATGVTLAFLPQANHIAGAGLKSRITIRFRNPANASARIYQATRSIGAGSRDGFQQAQFHSIVGIAHLTGTTVAEYQYIGWIIILALMHLSLGVINLIPLPPLDGGKLLLIAIECSRNGRKLPLKAEHAVNTAGFSLIIATAIWFTIQDILRF